MTNGYDIVYLGDDMYYLVGIQKEFVHVKNELQQTILQLIDQNNDKQLNHIIEMKYDETMVKFYEYLKDWEYIQAYRNAFFYTPSGSNSSVEAKLTAYGMLISDVPNNPMYRWFHYCYEDVLIMEIPQ